MELDFVGFKWNSGIQNFNLKYDFKYFRSDKFKYEFGTSHIYYDFNPGLLKPYGDVASVNREKLDNKNIINCFGSIFSFLVSSMQAILNVTNRHSKMYFIICSF